MDTPFHIVASLRRAIGLTWAHRKAALASFWPVFVFELFGRVATEYAPKSLSSWLAGATAILLAVPCATAWHRRLLLGEPPHLGWGRREWIFLWVSMCVGMAYMFGAMVVTATMVGLGVDKQVTTPVLALASLALLWLVSPLLLGLPAAALGHELPFRQALALAGRHRHRLFVLLAAMPLAEQILLTLAEALPFPLALPLHVAGLAFWPLTVAALSVAYMTLTAAPSEAEPP